MYDPPRHDEADYQVVEFEGDDPQWLFELLSNPLFDKVPPGQLQGLFARFQPFPVAAGQVVLSQGEPGDYYYLIRRGRARVSRCGLNGREAVLTDLGPGRGFGEEALISGEPRNATVTMLDDGLLMRLAAADFDALLRQPLVRDLDAAAAADMLSRGGQLVDVRIEDEFLRGSLPGAVNMPMYLLRIKATRLDRGRPVLLFCGDGRRAATAAFLLAQMGFDSRVIAARPADFVVPAAPG